MITAQVKEAENGFVLQLDVFDEETKKGYSELYICKDLDTLFSHLANGAGPKWDTKVIRPVVRPIK